MMPAEIQEERQGILCDHCMRDDTGANQVCSMAYCRTCPAKQRQQGGRAARSTEPPPSGSAAQPAAGANGQRAKALSRCAAMARVAHVVYLNDCGTHEDGVEGLAGEILNAGARGSGAAPPAPAAFPNLGHSVAHHEKHVHQQRVELE